MLSAAPMILLGASKMARFRLTPIISIIDAKNLYPSIEHDHMLSNIVPIIRTYFESKCQSQMGSFIISLTIALLRNQSFSTKAVSA